MTLKVLYVDTGIGLAGGQLSLIEILRFLDRDRIYPVVSSPPGSGLEEFCATRGMDWRPLPFATPQVTEGGRAGSGRVKGFLDAAYGVIHIASLVRRERVDIIHANTFRAGIAAGAAGRLTGVPMVFHSRAVYSHPPVGGLVAGASRRIVAISKTTAEPYARDHGDKIRIVPIGVDVERFCPPGAGPGGSLVGYLGRISPEKGLVNLVRSAPRIVSRVPSARFVVGGRPFSQEGERYLGAVRGEIKRRGLDDRFEWAGYVEDAPGFLARLSVVAVPSEEEGLGRTMLEAMAMERPVVAFDRGGPGETLTSGTDGVLVPPGDWDAMGNAIADLLADPETAALIGKAGRTRVEESYTGRASADALTDVYVEMVGGTR